MSSQLRNVRYVTYMAMKVTSTYVEEWRLNFYHFISTAIKHFVDTWWLSSSMNLKGRGEDNMQSTACRVCSIHSMHLFQPAGPWFLHSNGTQCSSLFQLELVRSFVPPERRRRKRKISSLCVTVSAWWSLFWLLFSRFTYPLVWLSFFSPTTILYAYIDM